MRITRSSNFTSGTDEVFAVIASEDHQQAKVAAQVADANATVTEQAGGITSVHTQRSLPTSGMPPAVSSLAGSTLTVTERQTWRPPASDGTRVADLEITVEGVPLRLQGTITLSQRGAGSQLAVDADLRCSVPFVGKKIEAAARPAIEESFDLEARLLSEQLA